MTRMRRYRSLAMRRYEPEPMILDFPIQASSRRPPLNLQSHHTHERWLSDNGYLLMTLGSVADKSGAWRDTYNFDSGRPMRDTICKPHPLPVFVGNSSAHFGVLFPIFDDSILAKGRLSLFLVPCNWFICLRKHRTHISLLTLQSLRRLSSLSN